MKHSMTIVDLYGEIITVTDLAAAIKQVEVFVSYHHEDETFKDLDRRLKNYWTDIQKKLLKLQAKTKTNEQAI